MCPDFVVLCSGSDVVLLFMFVFVFALHDVVLIGFGDVAFALFTRFVANFVVVFVVFSCVCLMCL